MKRLFVFITDVITLRRKSVQDLGDFDILIKNQDRIESYYHSDIGGTALTYLRNFLQNPKEKSTIPIGSDTVLTFHVTEDENKIQRLQRTWHTHEEFKIQFKKDLHFNIVLKIKGMATYSQSSTDLCSMTIPQSYVNKMPKIFWQESLNDTASYYNKSVFKNNDVEINYFIKYI